MPTYILFIDDDRYSIPTLQFATAADEAEIRTVAIAWLAHRHHRSVEVREGDKVLFRLEPQTGPLSDA